MKAKILLAVAALAGIALNAQAQSTEGNWMVRGRVVQIQPANKSDAIPAIGLPADEIHVSEKTIPEVDFTYFFTPNLAAELILTYPQKHDVSIAGSNAGSFKHLPPTLTAQYHFLPTGDIRPYVGAGINYTIISSVDLGGVDLKKSSVGLALQAGVDFKIGPQSFINLDIKKLNLQTDASLNGTKLSTVKLDPVLIGIGYGYRF